MPGPLFVEAMMSKPRKPKAPSSISDRVDGDSVKKYPNGIAATARAIAAYWVDNPTNPGKPLTIDQFYQETEFADCYEAIRKRYPGLGGRTPTKPDSVKTIPNNIAAGRHALEYGQIRALADMCKIPLGILLLFSQFVSMELRAKRSNASAQAGILDDIQAARRALDSLEADIRQGAKMIDTDRSKETKAFANIELLKRLCEAFNRRS